MILSYSQISLYKKCPRAWYNRYVQKNYGEPVNSLFFEGSVLHKLNEYYLTQPFPNVVRALQELSRIFVNEANRLNISDFSFADPAIVLAKISESFSKLVKIQNDLKITSSDAKKLEVPFKMTLGNTGSVINGFMDLVYRDTGNDIEIADFKNSDNAKYADPLQLQIYDAAYHLLNGIKPKKTFFIIVKSEQIVEHVFSEDDNKRMMDILIHLVNSLTSKLKIVSDAGMTEEVLDEEFPTKPEFLNCRYCAYRNSCLQSTVKNSNVMEGDLAL